MSKQLDDLFSDLYSFNTESFLKNLPKLETTELNTENAQGLSLLHVAASNGLNDAVVALLATNEVNPNHFNAQMVSPLQCAVQTDNGRSVKQLIAFGVSDEVLRKATQYAKQQRLEEMLIILNKSREEIVEQLVTQQAQKTFESFEEALLEEENKAKTPTENLDMFKHFDNMNYEDFLTDLERFKKAGGDINEREASAKGRTLLMMAAKDGLKRQVKALLDAGANPHLEDNVELSTLHYAGKGQSPGCLELIANAAMETGLKPAHAKAAIGFFDKGDNSPTLQALRHYVEEAKHKEETVQKGSLFSHLSPTKIIGGLVAAAGSVYVASLVLPELFPALVDESPEQKQCRRQQLGFFGNATSQALTGYSLFDVDDMTCPAP